MCNCVDIRKVYDYEYEWNIHQNNNDDILFTLLAFCGTQQVTTAECEIHVNVIVNVCGMKICHELIARRWSAPKELMAKSNLTLYT